jgi:hypothetical protein
LARPTDAETLADGAPEGVGTNRQFEERQLI